MWNQLTIFKGLVRSDHLAVMVTPRIQAKPERKRVYFRDVRQHRKISRIKVKTSRDPPHMSPLVKYLCNIRNKQMNKEAISDLQERIRNERISGTKTGSTK